MNKFLKRAFLALLVLFVLGLLLMLGVTYGALFISEWFPTKPRYDVFDDSEILMEVMTRTSCGKEGDKTVQYFALADGRRIRETAPFVPEPMTVYTDPHPVSIRTGHPDADGTVYLGQQGARGPAHSFIKYADFQRPPKTAFFA